MVENLDDFKIIYHPEKLSALIEGKISPPICVRVKPTNRCNHSCFHCLYKTEISGIHKDINQRDEIPREKMMEILNDFGEMGVKAVIYSGGGEPLIHPNILEIIKKTLDHNMDLAMITNGQGLNGLEAEILADNASWVRISANDCDAETFFKIRGRNEEWFYERNENIKKFAKMKKLSCKFGVHFVVNKENTSKIFEGAKFYKELGVDNIKFVPMWSKDFFEYHKSFRERSNEQIKIARQELEDDRFKISDTYETDFSSSKTSKRDFSKCYMMQVVPVIGADCGVYPCHDAAYEEQEKIGSIKDIPFKDLWFSKTKEFFEKFNPSERCKDHPCTNDKRNVAINKYIRSYKSLKRLKEKGIDYENIALFLYDEERNKEIVEDILNSYGEHINFI